MSIDLIIELQTAPSAKYSTCKTGLNRGICLSEPISGYLHPQVALGDLERIIHGWLYASTQPQLCVL